MDERMLQEYRREPDPRFARELRDRLRRHERAARTGLVMRFAAAACAVAVVIALFAIPSVRVSAESFLELFRVRRFAAVQFKESRFETLRSLGEDKESLVFDRTEKVVDPGRPRYVSSRDAASREVGYAVSAPGFLPGGLATDSIFVQGEGEVRLMVSEQKLRSLLQRLDVNDVQVPSGLDGRWIEVRKPPMVMQTFRSPRGNRTTTLLQAKSPEVSVPSGWDVERLVEIGLRVLGLDQGEARRIARSTDWRSTLLIPIPMNASTFRQVTVHGQQGLMITVTDRKDGRRRESALLLWSEGDRVFCLQSSMSGPALVQMAESVS